MPILRLDVSADHPAVGAAHLAHSMADLAPGAPLIVLLHGYKFSPHGPTSPHAHIYALDPAPERRRALSWPRGLGFGAGDAHEGLCLAFGWEARGSLWAARARADEAGTQLARLLDQVSAERPVHVVAHSLGASVALGALARLTSGHIDRMVLMAAAAHRTQARHALAAPAARRTEVLNIISRENDLFDAAWELLIRSDTRGDRALGAGLGRADPRWLDIQIDDPATLGRLADIGFAVAPPERRVCHWSPYMRPGLMAFYAAALRAPRQLPLATLRAHLPQPMTPRFSRLIARPPVNLPLPFARKAPS